MNDRQADARVLERRIGRMLVAWTYVAMALLLVGVALMVADGISPLAEAPPFTPGAIAAGLVALDPLAFLWLGLIVVIATPISRVIAASVGYLRARDWLMLGVSAGILLVITAGIAISAVEGG